MKQGRNDAPYVKYLSVGMENIVRVVDTLLGQNQKGLQQDTDSCLLQKETRVHQLINLALDCQIFNCVIVS